MNKQCYTCLAQSGERPIFPEGRITSGTFWTVGHGFPVGMKGWLVIVLKRHIEALHQVTSEEFQELSELIERLSKALRELLNCEKEYLMCFAEAEHFNHIHFHLVAKPAHLPSELKGPKIFAMLNTDTASSLNKVELVEFCRKLKNLV